MQLRVRKVRVSIPNETDEMSGQERERLNSTGTATSLFIQDETTNYSGQGY